MLNSFPCSEYNSSLRFYQFLSERLCVGWFFLCTGTRINFHWSIAFQCSSLSPSGLYIPLGLLFFPCIPFRSSHFFPSTSLSFLPHPFVVFLSSSLVYLSTVILSRRWFLRKERRRSEKDADRRYTYVRMCIAVRSRLSLPARTIPRFAAGPWETAHLPSFRWNGQTTEQRVSPLSLCCASPFTRQQPCGFLHLAASFSSNDTLLPLRSLVY